MKIITDAEIAAKQKEVEDLKALKLAQENSLLFDVAIKLHDQFCGYNHTDGCAWGYETREGHNWIGQAHQRWLKSAQKLVDGLESDAHATVIKDGCKIAISFLTHFKNANDVA